MKQILRYMSYAVFFLCCIAILYGIGVGIVHLFASESVGCFLAKLAGGAIIILLLVILGFLCVGIIESLFGDENSSFSKKIVESVDKIFP